MRWRSLAEVGAFEANGWLQQSMGRSVVELWLAGLLGGFGIAGVAIGWR